MSGTSHNVSTCQIADGETLTAAKLETMLAGIRKIVPPLPPDPMSMSLFTRPGNFLGFDMIERPEQPAKLRVDNDVPMTEAARYAMNAWLLERFGRLPDPGPLLIAGRYLSVTRKDAQSIYSLAAT